jgi:hypothetical protein
MLIAALNRLTGLHRKIPGRWSQGLIARHPAILQLSLVWPVNLAPQSETPYSSDTIVTVWKTVSSC